MTEPRVQFSAPPPQSGGTQRVNKRAPAMMVVTPEMEEYARMNRLEEWVASVADRECAAREHHGERGKDEKCLDANYTEETDPSKLERCDPCATRALLK